MARTDLVISATHPIALVPEAELDALREAVEVLEDSSWCGTAFEQLYEKLAIHSAALEAVEVLEDMYEQRDAEADRWFRQWLDESIEHGDTITKLHEAEAKANHYKTMWEDAERDIAVLKPTYPAERLIRELQYRA